MTDSGYALNITYKSNEYPWSTTYLPRHYWSDQEVLDWARRFRETLSEYSVTLLKDGQPVDMEVKADA